MLKKRFNAVILVAVSFGVVNLYEVVTKFGGQAVDLTPCWFMAFSIWVAVRNFVSFTCLPIAAVYWFGRHSRWLVIPGFFYILLVDIGTVYIGQTYHASLADEWLPLLLNTNLEESISFVKLTFTTGFAIGFGILLVVLVLFAKTLWQAVYPSIGRRNAVKGICLASIFVVFICLTMNFNFGIGQMTYSSFVLSSIKSWTEGRGIRDACRSVKLPETLSVDSDVRPDCVIVSVSQPRGTVGISTAIQGKRRQGLIRFAVQTVVALRSRILSAHNLQPIGHWHFSLRMFHLIINRLEVGLWQKSTGVPGIGVS